MSKQSGFSLMELMIAVLIVGILASVAYPSYTSAVTKSKRRAAQACLANYAQFMERYYTANMRYDENASGSEIALPVLDCASGANAGADYDFGLSAVGRFSYTLSASPKDDSVQAERDEKCGTQTLNQAGSHGATGSAGVAGCW